MPGIEVSSAALAIGLACVAGLLLLWQWLEGRRRGADLSDDDAAHFARQSWRRGIVAGVMVLLAVGVFVGSRLDPRDAVGRPNVRYLQTWLGVFLLVFILFVLAVADWLATRRYARRQRYAIVREGLEILKDEMRLRLRPGPGGPTGSEGGQPPVGDAPGSPVNGP